MADPLTVQVSELRGNLAKFLREAEQGTEFVVVSRDRPLARIGPVAPVGRRPIGLLKGKFEVPADFDEWPEDILASFEVDLDP